MNEKFETFIKYNPNTKDCVNKLWQFICTLADTDRDMIIDSIIMIMDQRVKIIYKHLIDDHSSNISTTNYATIHNSGSMNTDRSENKLKIKLLESAGKQIDKNEIHSSTMTKLEYQQCIVKHLKERKQELKKALIGMVGSTDSSKETMREDEAISLTSIISKALKHGTYDLCAGVLTTAMEYKLVCYHLEHLVEQ